MTFARRAGLMLCGVVMTAVAAVALFAIALAHECRMEHIPEVQPVAKAKPAAKPAPREAARPPANLKGDQLRAWREMIFVAAQKGGK